VEKPAAVARHRPADAQDPPTQDGISPSGTNNKKSSGPNDEADPTLAALDQEMGRFVERGKDSKPVVGRKKFDPPPPPPPRPAHNAASQPAGSGQSRTRPLPRTATENSTNSSQKKGGRT